MWRSMSRGYFFFYIKKSVADEFVRLQGEMEQFRSASPRFFVIQKIFEQWVADGTIVSFGPPFTPPIPPDHPEDYYIYANYRRYQDAAVPLIYDRREAIKTLKRKI
jgi:hypothetical protein